jgi:hypothetical protein
MKSAYNSLLYTSQIHVIGGNITHAICSISTIELALHYWAECRCIQDKFKYPHHNQL